MIYFEIVIHVEFFNFIGVLHIALGASVLRMAICVIERDRENGPYKYCYITKLSLTFVSKGAYIHSNLGENIASYIESFHY